jgi:hypothetical protein
LAFTALGTGAELAHAHEPQPTRVEPPTIGSHGGLPTDQLKTGEQVEVVSVEMRSVVRAPATSPSASARRTPTNALRANALRWCDLTQCRRLGGALVLGFATPPPVLA